MNQYNLKEDQSRSPTPLMLSVVIASVQPVRNLVACLEILIRQMHGKEVELIVANCCQDDSLKEIIARYPDIKFLHFSERTTLPILWGAGIEKAEGEIIAITESSCRVDGNWISAILKAHESHHPVIGGAVEATECNKLVDWAAYFCEYGQFMYPLREGAVKELPGNNISFKRWVLKKGQEFVQNGFWKTYWCRTLQENGVQLIMMPSIVVYDKKSYRLIPFLVRRFRHGHCFAGMRTTQISLLQRWCFVVGSPILPFLLLMRTIKAIASKKRYLKEFILSFPVSILAIVSWSFGEFWGYLAGPGDSSAHIY